MAMFAFVSRATTSEAMFKRPALPTPPILPSVDRDLHSPTGNVAWAIYVVHVERYMASACAWHGYIIEWSS